MKKLIEIFANPSGLDSAANYIGSIPPKNLLVVLARTRDSNLLTESNWEVARGMLGRAGKIIRMGHWACGWIEYLCVSENSKRLDIAEDIESALEKYPVLDDEHFSRLEDEEANRIWTEYYSTSERIEYIRKYRDNFEFQDMRDMMGCVRGKFFAGYANELINY